MWLYGNRKKLTVESACFLFALRLVSVVMDKHLSRQVLLPDDNTLERKVIGSSVSLRIRVNR